MTSASFAPATPLRAPTAMVSTVDVLATSAALAVLRRGGSAVDAAIAANAVLGVSLPNQCGLGGDLFALVQRPGDSPQALVGAGRSGSGADAARLRAEGHNVMPADLDVRSVTVPACLDAWLALHERYGRLEFPALLVDAIRYAEDGFPASGYLAGPLSRRAGAEVAVTADSSLAATRPGDRLRRPGLARVLRAIGRGGRDAFYLGEFGEALVAMSDGLFDEADLCSTQAEWARPLCLDVWGKRLWAPPPPSQGYLTLSSAWIAQRAGLPDDSDDPRWAHILIESTRQAAVDRPSVLFDGSEGAALLAPSRLAPRADAIRPEMVADLTDGYRRGGTTYLCIVDADGLAVSLIQSNCMSFGSGLIAGDTGIWLHNRGIGFSLEPGHPAEYGPRLRPPHTLAPLLVTGEDGWFDTAVGTRGGDSQPQIVLQLLARMLVTGQDPAAALAAGRWVLRGAGDETSFDTWGLGGRVRVALEGQVPAVWAEALSSIGHEVRREASFAHPFGHAQVIRREASGGLIGAADFRADAASVGGY
jgi:gamma-glutamyltranspeptidase/glutathione hydrolase